MKNISTIELHEDQLDNIAAGSPVYRTSSPVKKFFFHIGYGLDVTGQSVKDLAGSLKRGLQKGIDKLS